MCTRLSGSRKGQQQPNHHNVGENFINVQPDGIRNHGKVAKDEEKEKLFQRENSGEIRSSNAFLSKPQQNQSKMFCQESKVPSETVENIQNKSGSENQRTQKAAKKEGWTSISGILGGQGGFGWVQGEQFSNLICYLWPDLIQIMYCSAKQAR